MDVILASSSAKRAMSPDTPPQPSHHVYLGKRILNRIAKLLIVVLTPRHGANKYASGSPALNSN